MYYIKPAKEKDPFEKHQLISAVAKSVNAEEFVAHQAGKDGFFGVAIIDNTLFKVARVAYCNLEAKDIVEDRNDDREKFYYIMHIDQIRELDSDCADQIKSYVPPDN